jgi:tetratricopeptide (TPR) repeat protein
LRKDPNLLAARHNLALLLAGQSNSQPEAINLWRENLRLSPDYLPSRLSLAGILAERGDNAAAIEEYRKILEAKPGYPAARIALAGLLAKTGDTDAAIQELRQASTAGAQNPDIFEQIGDLEAGRQHATEARAAYQSAIDLTSDRGARKRIGNKIKALR